MCVEQLQKELEGRGIIVSQEDLGLCIEYTERVLNYNKSINLTAITCLEQALWLHVFDSLLLLPHLQKGTCIDMGTGGGFPGALLAIVSKQPWVLLDSKGKKMQVVNKICNDMHLTNVCCECDRVEDYAASHKEEYENVVVRALAKTDILLEYASPLQPIGGKLIVTKAHLTSEEKENAQKVSDIVGYGLLQETHDKLPWEDSERTILIYEKTAEAKVRLPRRAGMPTKKPLAAM